MDEIFECCFCSKRLPTSQGLKSHVTRLHKGAKDYSAHNFTRDKAASDNRLFPNTLESNLPKTDRFPSVQSQGNEASALQSSNTVPKQFYLENQQKDELQEQFDVSIEDCLTRLRTKYRVMKRIPRGARFLVADALASTIERCVLDNSDIAWRRLFLFATSCLSLPEHRSERQVSLTTQIKNRVDNFMQHKGDLGDTYVCDVRVSERKHRIPSESLIAKKVEEKVSEGDIRGAVRIICSEDVFAGNKLSAMEALKEKHPSGELQQEFPPPTGPGLPGYKPLRVTEFQVRKALTTFPLGSAGGLDALNPQHLKDLTSPTAGLAGDRLLAAMTKMSNFMLAGSVASNILPTLYGASMCALEKKTGGIRPIAVGNVFRRLVAKLGCDHIKDNIGALLRPVQLGFGTSGGAEAATHAARRFLSHEHETTKVFLKVDFLNAFNMLRRDRLLCMVREEMPELYPFLDQCYRSPSNLVFEGQIISSQRGVQQGDPLAPALFCMATRPISSAMKADLNLWYLDDAGLAGAPEVVLEDILVLKEKSVNLGLEVNPKKCEIFVIHQNSAESSQSVTAFNEILPGLKVMCPQECVLLGVPIRQEAVVNCVLSRSNDLKRLADRISLVSAHCGFQLLKNSFAIPRLNYLLRGSLAWKYPEALMKFDSILKSALESVTNNLLEDHSWCQSSLPVPMGGLGIRHATKLALPAFLASTCSVTNLVKDILPEQINSQVDVTFVEGLQEWTARSLTTPGTKAAQNRQHHWEDPLMRLDAARLLENASTAKERARLLGVSSREAGAWLHAIPSAPVGTFMDNDSFRIAIALRLGAPVCRPHTCPCGSQVDESGTHGLSCRRSAGRLSRHGTLNDIVKRALVSAGLPAVLEPPGLAREDGKRPDGMTLTPWSRGRSLVWDVTCVDTLAASHLESTSVTHGGAAASAEVKKNLKYHNLQDRFIFCPIAVETLGAYGPKTLPVVLELGRRITEASGEKRSTSYLLQRIGIAIQKGNAAAVMNTIPSGESLADYISLL